MLGNTPIGRILVVRSSEYEVKLPDDYFDIGVYEPRVEDDLYALWKAAYVLGADGVFSIGGKFRSNVMMEAIKRTPFRRYKNFDYLMACLSNALRLVGVDRTGERLRDFVHPTMAMYLLNTEDGRLPKSVLDKCHSVVAIERLHDYDLSPVAVGSILMWDRLNKGMC